MEFYRQTIEETAKELNTPLCGLTDLQAKESLKKHGKNELPEEDKKSAISVFFSQFKDFLVIILIISSVISMILGDIESAVVILTVITINAILGTVQEIKAEASLSSLKAMSTPTAKVIRNGEIVANYGSHRFAQYLGKEPTGQLGCAEVEVGTLTDDELASAPYFRCVSMSGIQLDILSDYIGGEVRLAYYVDGDKVIPMTGISISGKLSEALNSVRFSNVKECAGRYLGPKLASFEGIEIV
jgi:hypothetical protein